MTLEIIIPHEIEKLGPEAVKVYFEALSEGKEKIPYCNLLILGKEEVGKTSLLRQFVGEPFKEVLDHTRGINNETVDTFQRIDIDTIKEEWVAKKDSDINEQFIYGWAGNFMDKLREKHSETVDHVDLVTENGLLFQLGKIRTEHSVNPEPHGDEPDSGAQDTVNSPTEEKLYPKPTPDPEFKESNEPPTNTVKGGKLNSIESSIFNKIVVRKEPFKRVTPSVVFNVKDFAGQSIYRSMHHCLISEQGIFVVVFKLPDMLLYIQKKEEKKGMKPNPLDDITYWTQSIHAHITPTTSSNNGEGDKGEKVIQKRVLLVGTYRNQVKPKDLEEIDDFIDKEFMKKYRDCINHIHWMDKDKFKYAYFIPVENSIDLKRDKDYLEESGTKLVQDTIKAMSKKMSDLDKDYPIKWLKFEELLKQQCKSTQVIKREEINRLRIKSGIPEEQEELALNFFHKTGKIIYLSKYKLVYLSVCTAQ